MGPDDLIYPGARPQPGAGASQLGLFGVYETADPPDRVAAWYAGRGLPGQKVLLAGAIPSFQGSSTTTVSRLPLPWGRNALRVGRELHYMALDNGGSTVINLWCVPRCRPEDAPWLGFSFGQ